MTATYLSPALSLVIGLAACLFFGHRIMAAEMQPLLQAEPERSAQPSAIDLQAVQNLIAAGEGKERAGRLTAAEADYRAALNLDTASVTATTHLASVLEGEKQNMAAAEYWRRAVALQPANQNYRFSLATAYLNDGKNQPAAALLQEVVSKDTGFGDAYINLGAALTRLDRYADAVEIYRRAVQIPAVAETANLSIAKALLTLARFDEAKPYLDHYLALHPQSFEAISLEGSLHRSLHETKTAEQFLEQAVHSDPQSFDAQYNLGSVLREDGQVEAAIAHLKSAIALRPDAKEAHFQLARAYRAAHDTPSAEQQEATLKAEEQANSQRTQATVLGNRAMEAFHAREYQKAILDYQQILIMLPVDARPRYDLALVYDRINDRRQERKLLKEAEQLDPSLAGPHSQLGYLAMQDGQTAAAEAELGQALQHDPENVEALGNLGVLYGKLGRLDEAVHLLRIAIETDPLYQKGYLNLGLLLAAQGHYEESASILQKELRLNPEDATASRALALVRSRGAGSAGAK